MVLGRHSVIQYLSVHRQRLDFIGGGGQNVTAPAAVSAPLSNSASGGSNSGDERVPSISPPLHPVTSEAGAAMASEQVRDADL